MQKSDKLFLTKNGRDVVVTETVNTGDRENLVFGNYDRDIIIRTKGSLRVQVQNKFYDLLKDNQLTSLENVLTIDNSSDAIDLSVTGLHFVPSTGELYVVHGSQKYLIVQQISEASSGSSSGSTSDSVKAAFLSYAEAQSLTSTEIATALSNLKYLYNTIDDLPFNSHEGHLAFAGVSHFKKINGKWEPLYLSLLNGGQVKGNVSISKEEVNNTALLGIYGESSSYNDNDFEGLLIARPSKDKGLAVYANSEGVVLQSLTNGNVTFITENNQKPLVIKKSSLGVNRTPDDNLSLNVEGKSSFYELLIENRLTSSGYEPVNNLDYDNPIGAAIYKGYDEYDATQWYLEIDRLIEKNPELHYSLEGFGPQKLLSYNNHIVDLSIISDPESTTIIANVIFSKPDEVATGDIFIGLHYDTLSNIQKYIILEIQSKTQSSDELQIVAILRGEYHTHTNFSVVKIGNKLTDSEEDPEDRSILFDSFTKNIKIVSNTNDVLKILSTGEIPNVGAESPNLDPVYLKYPSEQIHTVLGDLREIVDEEFELEDNKEFGLYSDNAYIKGKASLDYLKLGDALKYENGKLSINLTEASEQLNEKIIRGVEGLHGSGTITDGKEAIEIKHNKRAWINKPDLPPNTVIVNLIFDEYGHVIDWVTRTLDIPSGGGGGNSGGGSGSSGGCGDCDGCNDC